jgi:hypothetical protein
MKNPNQVQQLNIKSLWLVYVARLWTHDVDNKKHALRELKKIIGNT